MEQQRVLVQRPGQFIGGHAIGIIVLQVGYPAMPGNVANASTYRYPVRFKVVEGSDVARIMAGDPTFLEPSLRAARELVQDGCRAIVGACGYWARYQGEMASALEVPVFMSSLCQAPLILSSIRSSEALGILCANRPALKPETLQAVGIPAAAPLVIYGLEDQPEFSSSILQGKGWLDRQAVEAEVVEKATRMCSEHPEVGAILLECSDIPPFALAVQRATGRPTWDYVTLIDWVHEGVVQRAYDGFI